MKEKIFFNSLNDDEIIQYSSGEVHNASNYKTIEKSFVAIEGGIYDAKIFGQKWRCLCGLLKHTGTCKECGVQVVDNKKQSTNYGYYRLFSNVVYPHKQYKFMEVMKKLFPTISIFNKKKLSLPTLLNCKFITMLDEKGCLIKDDVKYKIVIQEFDENDGIEQIHLYGINGIMNVVENYTHIHDDINIIKKYINSIIPISPIMGRMPMIIKGELRLPEMSSKYCLIIHFNKKVQEILQIKDYSLADYLMLQMKLNELINLLMKNYSLISYSKGSFLRNLTTTRVPKSGSAIIIGTTDCDVDECFVPIQLAYEAIKKRLIEKLNEIELKKCQENENYEIKNAHKMYEEPDEYVMEVFYAIIQGSEKYNETGTVCILNRPPSLHKLSLAAFKPIIWEKPAIGLHILVTKGFNADFDGDRMVLYFFTKDPVKTKVIDKMGVANNWLMDKNKELVFNLTDGFVLGCFYATQFGKEINKCYKNFTALEKDFREKKIDFDDVISFIHPENFSTYGREKINYILKMNINDFTKNEPIKLKTLQQIIISLKNKVNACKMLSNLVRFSKTIITLNENSILCLGDFFKINTKFTNIEQCLNRNISDTEKFCYIEKNIGENIKKSLQKINSKNYKEYQESQLLLKNQSIVEIMGTQFHIENEKFIIYEENLLNGLSDISLLKHAISNREILNQKSKLVPIAGYATRQIVKNNWDIVYKKNEMSKDSDGIILPKWMAEGRTDLNNNIIQKNYNNDFVKIKSCVNSKEKNVICYNEINNSFFKYNDNDLLGVNFSTSITEDVMQDSLGLKHGGRVWIASPSSFSLPFKTTIVELNEKSITLKDQQNNILKFPITNKTIVNSEGIEKKEYNENEYIFFHNQIDYVDHKVASLSNYIGLLTGEMTTKKIKRANCYSLNDGIISYIDDKTIKIGEEKYDMEQEQIYYFAEGQKVKFGDRICSGLYDLQNEKFKTSENGKKFFIFLKQFIELLKGENNLEKQKMSMALESLELIFKRIKDNDFSVIKTNNNGNDLTKASYSRAFGVISKILGKTLEDGFILRLITGKKF